MWGQRPSRRTTRTSLTPDLLGLVEGNDGALYRLSDAREGNLRFGQLSLRPADLSLNLGSAVNGRPPGPIVW